MHRLERAANSLRHRRVNVRRYGGHMCFSPQADLVGGAIIGTLGVASILKLRRRTTHVAIAALPIILAAHQIDEAFVWWGLQGHVPKSVEHVALWIYLLVAFVLLPVFVPLAVLSFEASGRRRLLMSPFVAIGTGVAAVLLATMIRGPIGVTLHPYHLSYNLKLHHGLLIVTFYVIAVCGALLLSGERHIVAFGVLNVIAIVIIAKLTIDGFASVWCGWAAICSGAIVLQLRLKEHHDVRTVAIT
jgi:hypothetical protein